MSFITLDPWPGSKLVLFSSQSMREETPLNDLQKQPNKLLIAYLKYRSNVHTGLQSEVEKAALKVLEEALLTLHTEEKLSDYHFIKLLSNSRELLVGREEEFQKKLQKLIEELAKNPDEKKRVFVAAKIAKWIRGLPLNDADRNFFYAHFYSSDMKQIPISRFQWALQIPALVPMFIGNWKQHEPINMSENTIQLVDGFIQGSLNIQELSDEVLIQLFQDTLYLQFNNLQKAIIEALILKLTPDNILDITKITLDYKFSKSISSCFTYLSSAGCGLTLTWKDGKGVILKIGKLPANGFRILECLSTEIKTIQFSGQNVVKQLATANFTFLNVSKFVILRKFRPEIIALIPRILLNAKEMEITNSEFARDLGQKDMNRLTNIEFLHIKNSFQNTRPLPLPPNLKLLTFNCRNNQSYCRRDGNMLVCSFGKSEYSFCDENLWLLIHGEDILLHLLLDMAKCHPELSSLCLNKFALSNGIVRDLVVRFKNLRSLSLHKCNLSDETILFIARNHPRLHTLELHSCQVSTQTHVQLESLLPACSVIFKDDPASKRPKMDLDHDADRLA